jgi:hypothetical protein
VSRGPSKIIHRGPKGSPNSSGFHLFRVQEAEHARSLDEPGASWAPRSCVFKGEKLPPRCRLLESYYRLHQAQRSMFNQRTDKIGKPANRLARAFSLPKRKKIKRTGARSHLRSAAVKGASPPPFSAASTHAIKPTRPRPSPITPHATPPNRSLAERNPPSHLH